MGRVEEIEIIHDGESLEQMHAVAINQENNSSVGLLQISENEFLLVESGRENGRLTVKQLFAGTAIEMLTIRDVLNKWYRNIWEEENGSIDDVPF